MANIQLFYEDIAPIHLRKSYIKLKIKELILAESFKTGEISVIFCSDKYLLNINKRFLNHDYFTDIVTFNYVENGYISGDLFISLDRIKENAKNYNIDFYKELMRVVFHGILHLIGYNDKTEKETKQIREKEDSYLKEIDFGGLVI